MMRKTVCVLAAALAMPAVAALGQQSGASNGDASSHQSQYRGSQSTHDENHAVQTRSPNDNGAGGTGDYGGTKPGRKVHKKQDNYRSSEKYTHQTVPNQTDMRYTGEAHPQ